LSNRGNEKARGAGLGSGTLISWVHDTGCDRADKGGVAKRFGLFVSTVLTLVVVPVVYFAVMRNSLEKITAAV
jgi:hypothetical protein